MIVQSSHQRPRLTRICPNIEAANDAKIATHYDLDADQTAI